MTGTSRTDEMIESQSFHKESNDTIHLQGKYVKIVPKIGHDIIGLFIGEKRLYEFSRTNIFVIEVSSGIRAYISRDDVSYIVVSETGFIDVTLDSDEKINALFGVSE